MLPAFGLTLSKQNIINKASTNKITHLPQSEPSTNKTYQTQSKPQQQQQKQNLPHLSIINHQINQSSPYNHPIATMSDALIFEYLSASRPSKRASHASQNDHSAMTSSHTPANNRSDIRASVSGKGRDGKRGSLDWIRGMGKKA